MNDKEKEVAASLLKQMETANPADAQALAAAYQHLTQGAFNRRNAECR